jgi:hypothetical protein
MTWIKAILGKLGAWFASPSGKQAVDDINTLVQIALPIVEEVSALTGNAGAAASVAAVQAAYTKYGVPLTQGLTAGDSLGIGNALMNLATAVLRKNLPANKAGVATNILNTAVSLAVTATKVAL